MIHIVIRIMRSCKPTQNCCRVSPAGPFSRDMKYPNTTPTNTSASS